MRRLAPATRLAALARLAVSWPRTSYTLVCALAILLLAGGALNWLSPASPPGPMATRAVVVYWGFGIAVISAARAWSRVRRELMVVLGAVVLAVSVIEVLLRVLDLPFGLPPLHAVGSRRYHHIHPPNRRMFQGLVEGRPVVIHTNDDGLRTRFSRAGFRRSPRRVAVLGDSFAFGFGVRDGATIADRLEHHLREMTGRGDVAVLNAGIVSSSPILAHEVFQGIVASYDPHIVLLLLDATDIGDDITYERRRRVEGNEVVFDVPDEPSRLDVGRVLTIAAPLAHAAASPVRWAWTQLTGRRPFSYYQFELQLDHGVERSRFFIFRYPRAVTDRYFGATLANVRRLADAVRRRGMAFGLVVNPRHHLWDAQNCPDSWEAKEYSSSDPYIMEYVRFFDEASAGVDFPILSLLEPLRAWQGAPLLIACDPHWNEVGSDVAAEAIARWLGTVMPERLERPMTPVSGRSD